MISENKALVTRAHDAFLSGDRATLRELLARNCMLHQCGFLNPVVGADRIIELSSQAESTFSSRERHIAAIAADGDTVAIRFTTTGRHNGAMFGPPTGKSVTFDSMMFVRVDNGLVAEIWNIQDTASIMSQLAVEPDTSVA